MSNSLKAAIQAAAEVTGTVSTGGGKVDQEFDSTSKNAQSGVAIAGELEKYVVKEPGKGLSSNDYTDAEKKKNENNATKITALQSNKADKAALNNYVKFTDFAEKSKGGVVCVNDANGITLNQVKELEIYGALPIMIENRNSNCPITPKNLNTAVKAALTDSKRITGMTDSEKANARDVIGAEQKTTIVPWASTLTEMSVNFPGITEYVQICDHDITTLSLGVSAAVPVGYECSFTFQSGATATTITYPGELFKFVGVDCDADGDFVASANTNYEVSVRNLSTNPETPLLVARVGVY